MYIGHVYKKYDGKPIRGIAVSDGRNVTLTDSEGAFSLPGFERSHLIYVSALTTSHDDWYIRIDGRESYDFYISEAPRQSEAKYLHVSDTELSVPPNEPFVDFLAGAVSDYSPDFLIHTGDICRIGGLMKHYKIMNYETVGCPVRYTLGNHDFVNDVYGEYSYEKYYGPINYSFDVGGTHFAILPIRGGEAKSGYDPFDSYLWLENDLKVMDKSKNLVIFRHDGPTVDFKIKCHGELVDLKNYGLIAWQYGHLHQNFTYEDSGVQVICTARPDCGGIDQTPASTRLTEIDKNGKIHSEIIYHTKYNNRSLDLPLRLTSLESDVLFADPVLYDGRLYVATSDDGIVKNAGIVCLDAETLEVIYKFDTDNAVKGSFVVSDGVIYAEDCMGKVYAFDIDSRECIYETTPKEGYTVKGLVLDGDILFAGCENEISALDKKTGRLLYSAEPEKNICTCTARYVITDDKILVGVNWLGLIAYDKKTLKKLWLSKDIIDSTATPLVSGEFVYGSSRGVFFKISLSTGECVASKKYEPEIGFDSVGSPLIHNGRIIAPSSTHGVVVLDEKTLDVIKILDVSEVIVPAAAYTPHGTRAVMHTPIIHGDELVFAGADGVIYFYDLETLTEKKKIHTLGGPIYTSPVIYGDTVIFADLFGKVFGYNI